MRLRWLALVTIFAGAAGEAGAAERRVANAAALAGAMRAARPGDVIVLEDGVWTDVDIRFDATASARAPVRLRARTPGGVVLTGSSRLTFLAPHLIAEGLYFRGGALKEGAVVRFASDHGRLTESAIVDYNPTDPGTEYPWVLLDGSDNRVDASFFRGKNNRRPVVANGGPGMRRNRVEGCHFKDIAFRRQNGREVIQIKGYGMSEELGEDGAFFTVERNLFEEAHGEGMEIISIKSNRNVIRGNTFRKTKGGITNRSGNFNVIEGNVILGENEPGSYGIRVTGRHQRVVGNYVADVDGAGLLLVAGEHIEDALTPRWEPLAREGTPLGRVPRYAQVKDSLFANNTLVGCGSPAIEIGSSYKAGWPGGQRVLLPEGNQIVDNRVQARADAAGAGGGGKQAIIEVVAADGAPPLDRFRFAGNRVEGNLLAGASVAGVAGFRVVPRAAPGTGAGPSRALRSADVGPRWMRARGQNGAGAGGFTGRSGRKEGQSRSQR